MQSGSHVDFGLLPSHSQVGLVIGVPIALLSARVLRSMLFGIEPTDPLSSASQHAHPVAEDTGIHRPARPFALQGHELPALMRIEDDAFGHALHDQLAGHEAHELIERDDGYIDVSARAGRYFDPPENWSEFARSVLDRMNGRVLDVGCGAGRIALPLQDRGHAVVAIDISPLAVEVCRLRGVKDARVLAVHRVGRRLGKFDTIAMMGNNFGLFGNARRARSILARFHRLTSPAGRIVAETMDPYRTREPQHLEYHERNRRKGRMPGQVRMRVRYKRYRTPWFDYLFVSRSELESLVAGTNWQITDILESGGPGYVAILEKSPVTI